MLAFVNKNLSVSLFSSQLQKWQLADFANIAIDMQNSTLNKKTISVYLNKIGLFPEKLKTSNIPHLYFTSILKDLTARAKLGTFLKMLYEDGYPFVDIWMLKVMFIENFELPSDYRTRYGKIKISYICELAQAVIENNVGPEEFALSIMKLNFDPLVYKGSYGIETHINAIQHIARSKKLGEWLLPFAQSGLIFAQKWIAKLIKESLISIKPCNGVLDLSKLCLDFFPLQFIDELEGLHTLDLSENKLAEFPIELLNTNLIYLSLQSNLIEKLPRNINELTKIRHLNISNNNLKNLPKELFDINFSQIVVNNSDLNSGLNISGNTLKSPPFEVAKQGIRAVSNYFELLKEGNTTVNEMKLIFTKIYNAQVYCMHA